MSNDNSRMVALLEDFAIWSKGLVSPPTSFIPYTASYNAMKARTRISKVLIDIIKEETMLGNNLSETKTCVIRRLLYDGTKGNATVGDKSPLTEEATVDNIFTLVFAGTDTTASILTSAFYELEKNHEVRQQIQACIDSVENLDHENEELDELLRAFLSEVQRCYPAAPFTMRHISGQGIDLGDFGCIPP
eukprot:scaffold155729_cov23-Cyclotella_meneghiniana.AAC.1